MNKENKYQKTLIIAILLFLAVYGLIYFQSTIQILTIEEVGKTLILNIPLFLGLILFNSFYLLPKYFKKSDFISYFVLILLLVFIASFFRMFVYRNFQLLQSISLQANFITRFFYFFISTGIITLTTSIFWLIKEWMEKREEEQFLNNAKREAELKFLRAQINPHMLFNTLNNIYAFTQFEPKKAGEMILSLSDIMRFLLYDSNTELIPIEKEILAIEKTIELHRTSLPENAKIQFENQIAYSFSIPPLLLLPFFENAFKHSSIGRNENAFIIASLSFNNNVLELFIKNSFDENKSKDDVGGIGLQNIKDRLQLLFANKHQLKIEIQDYIFIAQLNINLDEKS